MVAGFLGASLRKARGTRNGAQFRQNLGFLTLIIVLRGA